MSASAIRLIACAGALATGLLLAGAGAGMSVADPGDPTSGGSEGATATGTDANPDGGSGWQRGQTGQRTARPLRSVRAATTTTLNRPVRKRRSPSPASAPSAPSAPGRSSSTRCPYPSFGCRRPRKSMRTGWPDPSVFFGTLEVPVPSIDGFLTALSQPEPEPTPGLRSGDNEEAPVIDVTGGGGGVASMAAAENNGAPPVFELPLVVAPAIPIPGVVAPTVPLGASAPAESADGRRRPDRRCRREGAVDPRIVVIDRGNSEDDHDTHERAGHPGGLSAGPSQPDGRSARRRCAAGRGRTDVFHVQRRRHRIPAGQQHPIHPHHGRGAVPLEQRGLGARRRGPHTCASPHPTNGFNR